MSTPLLDIRNLRIDYAGSQGRRSAVNGLSFAIGEGEAVSLVGESGCGKSTTAMSILGLLPKGAKVSGAIDYLGQDLAAASEKQLRRIRGNDIGVIFQEPMTSLNPVHTVGAQIVEVLREHTRLSRRAAQSRAIELLDLVRVPEPAKRFSNYPHELSGGQRQRVMIAIAVACEPKLLIADEPTTALDATVQSQILELIDGLRKQLSMGLLLISHDLSLVSRWSDRVIVMHHGERMEELDSQALFVDGTHAYTKGLVGASIRIADARHYKTSRLSEIRSQQNADETYQFKLVTPAASIVSAVAPVSEPILSVRQLGCSYQGKRGTVKAVDDVSFDIAPGETLGLVGESGSGKSTVSKAVLRLIPSQSGKIVFEGTDITGLHGEPLRQIRRNMQMIFQDPYSSLNPRQTVSDIFGNVLKAHGISDERERSRRISEALDHVNLPRTALQSYAHQFSGGQRQRIAIGRALILRPRLLICDEPVSALDVSVQAQILNLLADIKSDLGLSCLFISHDLAVVQFVSDRVMVMSKGAIVEENDHLNIWKNPVHPYTRALLQAAH